MFCPSCGQPNPDNARFCATCGGAVPSEAPKYDPTRELAMLAPINTDGFAIAAGYLALFSVLVVPAPLALICGLAALRRLKSRPGVRGRVRAWFGIIMGALFSVVLALGAAALLMDG